MKEQQEREPQVFDTIGKGGDYWRITDIDEKGSVTAWRIWNGTIFKKGRPLRIDINKIKDGTYRLLDLPPVKISKREDREEPASEEEPEKEPYQDLREDPIKPPITEEEFEEERKLKDIFMHGQSQYADMYEKTRKRLVEEIETKEQLTRINRELGEERDRVKHDLEKAQRDLEIIRGQLVAAMKDLEKQRGMVEAWWAVIKAVIGNAQEGRE